MKPAKYACLFMLLLCCSFVGCSTGQRDTALAGADLMVEASVADAKIQSGVVTQTILKAPLTEGELITLEIVVAQYTASREALGNLMGSPAEVLLAAQTIRAEHQNLREAFLLLVTVVEDHYPTYSAVDQLRLALWRDQVIALEAKYKVFLAQVNAQISTDARQAAAWELLKIATQIALTVV